MLIFFTDLDGTLLDDNYRWEAAAPALERLRKQGIPWVFTTSKTAAEVEVWRQRLGNRHPFIVENGGAAFVPDGYFPFEIPGARRHGRYLAIEWGAQYPRLIAALQEASRSSGCPVRGFHAMNADEVAQACGLSVEDSALARDRGYDEPFEILDATRAQALCEAIERAGFRWTRGGRFWHIHGDSDKGRAVREVARLYARGGEPVTTVGLGDSPNDLPMMKTVDIPIVIRSASFDPASEVGRFPVTRSPAPEGWNEAVNSVLDR